MIDSIKPVNSSEVQLTQNLSAPKPHFNSIQAAPKRAGISNQDACLYLLLAVLCVKVSPAFLLFLGFAGFYLVAQALLGLPEGPQGGSQAPTGLESIQIKRKRKKNGMEIPE